MTRSFLWAATLSFAAWFYPLSAYADDIVVILRARGNPYWTSVRQGVEETAELKGLRAVVYEGESDRASEEQLTLCYTAIERSPKVLAIAAGNVPIGIQCLKRAAERGIKVADIDAQLPLEEAKRAGLHLSFSVGSDNFSIGHQAAKLAASMFPKDAPRILILEGAPGAVAGIQRTAGFREEIEHTLPNARIVASISGEWDRLKGMNITLDVLQREKDLNLVYAVNDMMALGALEALKTTHRTATVRVIGVDGTAEARRAVLKGDLTATVAQLPFLIGKRVVELSHRVIKGEEVPQREVIDTPVLTKEALENKNSPFVEYLR